MDKIIKKRLNSSLIILILLIGGCLIGNYINNLNATYTIEMLQYNHSKEYSEGDWHREDIAIEYPVINGIGNEAMKKINKQAYDMSFKAFDYWYTVLEKTFPSETTFFDCQVDCRIGFHSQYLVSMNFWETYSAVSHFELDGVNGTERGLTVDLETGEEYSIYDIFKIDRAFVEVWIDALKDKYPKGITYEYDEDFTDFILEMFQEQGEKLGPEFDIFPYYYICNNRNFAVGLAIEPKLKKVSYYEPTRNYLCVEMYPEELMEFRTDNAFWDKLDQSLTVGKVIECKNKKSIKWYYNGRELHRKGIRR